MTAPVYVVYHAECLDGFGAAWAAFQALGHQTNNGNPVHYIPSKYGESPPDTDPEGQLYILDFSYNRTTMEALHLKHGGRLTLLDHHKTAMEELQGRIPGCHFDMEKSGAIMAWDFFNPFTKPPELLDYVQDRDLWQWRLPQSRALNTALKEKPMEFDAWSSLSVKDLIEEGQGLMQEAYERIDAILESQIRIEIGQERAPAVETEFMPSETAEVMLQRNPDASCVAVFHHSTSREGLPATKFSLRSRGDFDVSKMAKAEGGGGHAAAAGFMTLDVNEPDTEKHQHPDTRALGRRHIARLMAGTPDTLTKAAQETLEKINLLQLAANAVALQDLGLQASFNQLKDQTDQATFLKALRTLAEHPDEVPRPNCALAEDPDRSDEIIRATYPSRQTFPKNPQANV